MNENYIWAFDIGSRSVGWAVMKAGPEESQYSPTGEVVATGVTIHSGGILTEKDGTTRHGARGMVVRNRRRLKRKKTRRHTLKQLQAEAGIVKQEGWRDRNPWWSRYTLAEAPVPDPARVRHLLATALPHMSKHRGWRNPWVRSPRPDSFDPEKVKDVAEAAEALSELAGATVPPTLGAVSWTLMQQRGPSKVRQSSNDPGEGQANLNQWVLKVMQEHIAAEMAEIWRVQKATHPDLFTDEALEKLCEAILHQEKPGVPLDRVGRCDIDNRRYRAPKSSPTFQRYRLLDVASNLRVEDANGNRDRLSLGQRDAVVALLDRGEQISWGEIEESIGLFEGRLVHSDRKGTAGRPPVNVISERLKSVKGITKLAKWWDKADLNRREALVAMAITDLTFNEEDPAMLEEVAKEMEEDGLLETVERFGRSLPPGRASYSRQVLEDLIVQMEAGSDLHDAIRDTYGLETAKSQIRWEDPVPNNGAELSMKEVRGIAAKLDAEFGAPAVIGVEIVRDATLSHADRQERSRRIERERGSRDDAKQIVEGLGFTQPTPSVIAKQEHITAQGGVCLYCGTKLMLPTTELDHIVPRKTGGATIFNNLAAVCRPCNQAKGHKPFGRWCEEGGEAGEKRMEETLALLDQLSGPRWKATPTKPYIDPDTRKWVYSDLDMARRDYRRRLQKTEWDKEFDDAEIHSTAFIGRAAADRFRARYPEARVDVFRGGFTAAMRNETRLAKHLGLGDKKDRGGSAPSRYGRDRHRPPDKCHLGRTGPSTQ